MSRRESKAPWYREGLAFSCTRCGACCTGAPGFVWVSPDEIERLAEFRGETVDEFAARFVRQVHGRYSLIEKPGGDCIFWDKQAGCTVYPARPVQCQTWPFWPENVQTPEDWDHTREVCPGSGRGRLYTVDEIVSALSRTPK
jgi:Fe-S-cluster containining protein